MTQWVFGVGSLVMMAACQPAATPASGLPVATGATSVAPAAVAASSSSAPHAATPPLRDDLVIAAVGVPANLNVDGDTSEWASSVTSKRMLYVAPGPDRLAIAASLPSLDQPLTIALTSSIPSVPDIGWVSRGGGTHRLDAETCAHQQIRGAEGSWGDGEPHPPEVVKACLAAVARRQAFVDSFYRRFVRHIELSRSGVTVDGKVLEGTVFMARNGEVEVVLPLAAMPQLSQAPLTALFARASEGPLPNDVPLPIEEWNTKIDARWSALEFSQAISYEPNALPRKLVFAGYEGMTRAMSSLSYHPSDPHHITAVTTSENGTLSMGDDSPTRATVVESSRKLFEPLEEFGEVQIGLVDGSTLISTKAGQLVQEMFIGDILGVQRRNDQLHFFSYTEGGYNPFMGLRVPPRWNVVAVNKDGTPAADVADEGVDFMGDWSAWDKDPQRFNDKTFTKFGMRGVRKKRTKTVTWVWDESTKHYVVGVVPKDATQAADYEAGRIGG